MKTQTISTIKQSKNRQQLSMITAYDALFASLFDKNIDIILVGDSLGMSFGGYDDTLSVTMKQMIYHTKAVCNGAKNTFVVCDMPFGSVTNKKLALKNATKVFQQTSADAIKIEGGKSKQDIIKYLTDNSIAVMGHIGLMPQFVRNTGGYQVRGKTKKDTKLLVEDAKALEEAGVFAIVLEGVKAQISKEITQAVKIPVIGIGAGADVDGQVLVWSDMFGFFESFKPKFVKEYLDGAKLIKDGLKSYIDDINNTKFPSKNEQY